MKQSHDVIVIGAGPAGAILAYELARRGIRVLVLEKEQLPRYKCCAGGVTNKAAKLLDFDISEVAEDVIYEVSFAFDGGTPYVRRHNQALMYTILRDVFDHVLIKRAQQLGAVLRDGQEVTQVRVIADWVEISTADNIFCSRVVAGADGAYSVVARELGMEKRMEYVAGMESDVIVSAKESVKWKSTVRMDLGCVPGGCAWVFPKRNQLSVGVGCLASRARHLNRYHQKFLDSLGVGSCTIARSSTHLIPTCTKGGLVWQDKALLVGDAAGLADPLTGEGIHNAILSAQLAAPVIENRLLGRKVRLQDYQEAIENKIMPELRIARTLSKFLFRFPHLAFKMLNRSDGVWRAGCNLMLGEIDYAGIKMKAGGFKGILSRLLGA